MKVYKYQPGNGTRYDAFFEQIEDEETADLLCISPGGWLIGLVNIRGANCYAFQPTGYIDTGYVHTHMNLPGEADAEAVAQLIAHVTSRPIRNPWGKCGACGLPIRPGYDVPYCITCEYSDRAVAEVCAIIRNGKRG